MDDLLGGSDTPAPAAAADTDLLGGGTPQDAAPDGGTPEPTAKVDIDQNLVDRLGHAGLEGDRATDVATVLSMFEDGKILGKYTSIQDVVNGYRESSAEARKLVEDKNKNTPPDQYELTVPEGLELSDDDFKQFKESGYTQDQAQMMVDFINDKYSQPAQAIVQENQELKLRAELGFSPKDSGYDEYISGLRTWAASNIPEDALSVLRGSSEGVVALSKMRKADVSLSNPSTTTSQAQSTDTGIEDVYKNMDQERFITDEAYRNEMNERIKPFMS
jgi:hypothetical protein